MLVMMMIILLIFQERAGHNEPWWHSFPKRVNCSGDAGTSSPSQILRDVTRQQIPILKKYPKLFTNNLQEYRKSTEKKTKYPIWNRDKSLNESLIIMHIMQGLMCFHIHILYESRNVQNVGQSLLNIWIGQRLLVLNATEVWLRVALPRFLKIGPIWSNPHPLTFTFLLGSFGGQSII